MRSIALLALSGGDAALIVLAAFWGLLVLFLGLVLVNTFRMIESTKLLIDGIREETMPLLREVTTTVSNVNRELERVDGMLDSAGNVVRAAERVAGLVEQAVSSPLVKLISAGAGARSAFKRFRGRAGGS